MKRILIFVFAICFSLPAFSQRLLEGKVFDRETLEPLAGVNVVIRGTTTGAVTRADGAFSFVVPPPAREVEVSFIGYDTKIVAIDTAAALFIALSHSVNNLQQVVVTASREAALRTGSPVAISRLSPSVLNDTKPVLIAELMNKVPGVVMPDYSNEQHAMSIRQPMGTSPYFLYMEDGIPIRPMGIFNHNALIEMNVFGISGVEVVKGPASSLYGPEAVGGAVNFITHRPTAKPVARLALQGDQWGYKRFQYGGGGMLTKKLGIYISGFRARQRNSWQSNSDYDKSSVNARVDYMLTSRTAFTLAFSGNEYTSGMAGSVDSIAFYSRKYNSPANFTYRKVHSQRTRFTVSQQWNDKNKTLLTLAYRDNYIEQNPEYRIQWATGSSVASGEINRNSFYSRVAILQHRIRFNFMDARLLAGASIDYSPTDYWAYQVDLAAQLRPDGKSVEKYAIIQKRPDVYLSKYQADLKNSAFYSQFEINPVDPLKITLGLRYDKMAFDYSNYLDGASGIKTYDRITPKAGATYALNPDVGFYINYSQGFSPPGLTAIFRKKSNTDGSAEATFNYDLEPAQFDNFEIGGWSAFFDNKLYMDFSMYQMNGRKELLNIRQPDNSFDYESAGKTLHRGIEYSITFRPDTEWLVRFGGTNAIHRFREFTLSAPGTDEVKNVNGKEMPQAPHWIANSEVTYKPAYAKGLRLSLEWQRLSGWYEDQVNAVKYDDRGFLGMKGVSYINLRAGYAWKSVEVFMNVMNATDELYANAATRGNASTSRTDFTPAAPRTFVMGIQYNFTGKKITF